MAAPILPDGVDELDFAGAMTGGPWASLGQSLTEAGAWLARAQADEARGAHHTAALVLRTVESWMPELVATARADGATWADVGTSHGISRQAACERFGAARSVELEPEPTPCHFAGKRATCSQVATTARGSVPLCEPCESSGSSLTRLPRVRRRPGAGGG